MAAEIISFDEIKKRHEAETGIGEPPKEITCLTLRVANSLTRFAENAIIEQQKNDLERAIAKELGKFCTTIFIKKFFYNGTIRKEDIEWAPVILHRHDFITWFRDFIKASISNPDLLEIEMDNAAKAKIIFYCCFGYGEALDYILFHKTDDKYRDQTKDILKQAEFCLH